MGDDDVPVRFHEGIERVERLPWPWPAIRRYGDVVLDTFDAPPRKIFPSVKHPREIAWADGGRRIYVGAGDVFEVDPVTGTSRLALNVPDGWTIFGLFAPAHAGDRLALRWWDRGKDATGLTVYGLRDGTRTAILEPIGKRHLTHFSINWEKDLAAGHMSIYYERTELWTASLSSGARRKIVDMPDGTHDYALSPDGTRLAYSLRNGVYVLHLGTRKLEMISRRGENPAWSPDSSSIAFCEGESSLIVHDLKSRERVQLASLVPSAATRPWYTDTPVWSSDGTMLFFGFGVVWPGRDRGWGTERFVGIIDLDHSVAIVKKGDWRDFAFRPTRA